MSMTAYRYSSVARTFVIIIIIFFNTSVREIWLTHARRAKGNPVPIPEPGSGTAYNSGPRKSVRRGNPK